MRALFRRHGGVRSLQLIRDLVGVYGIRAVIRQILSRLKQADNNSVFDTGPIGQLVRRDVLSRKSVACFASNIVLIGSLDLPQCRKYRVIQRQEMIECITGTKLVVADYNNVNHWRTQLQIAAKVVLYRIPNQKIVQDILTESRRLGLAVCYDIDDAVFDLDTVKSNPNLTYLSRRVRKALFHDALVFSEAMHQCDIITVSTPGLQRLVKRRFPAIPCYVVPNGVDAETIHYGAVARKQASASGSKPFRILIPSGSLAHAADTDVVIDGVRHFLGRCSEAQIVTMGHFDAGNALHNNPALKLHNDPALKKLPFLPYSEYLRVLATVDCVLVPLADSKFNNGKSIVRLIDATEVGVPVVASPIGEYSELALASAFFPARSPEEWRDALETIAASRQEVSRLLMAATQGVRTPRLLGAIWKALDPQLHAFFGARASHALDPQVEARVDIHESSDRKCVLPTNIVRRRDHRS
jgi:glycosyltransferase involved in cell wall biosynthesis